MQAPRLTLLLLLFSVICTPIDAGGIESEQPADWSLLVRNSQIAEPYRFFGLASFYNEVRVDLVQQNTTQSVPADDEVRILASEWLVLSGRFAAHAIRAEGLTYRVDEHGLWAKGQRQNESTASGDISVTTTKAALKTIAPELDQLRYAHLWGWLGALAKGVEVTLTFIYTHIAASWAVAILILSLFVKLLLLPVSLLTARLQKRVRQVQSQLLPELAQVKANYEGEEAHERIMAAHSRLGVSPFYTLKPMLGTFIQLPILVAVFNALGEMQVLRGASFLWVEDLSYPDAITQLNVAIPLLGTKLSVLPFLMTAATWLATASVESRAEKVRLLLMSAGFLVLFYPFPAAMVLYWTATNLLQLPLQKLLRAQPD